MFITNYLSHVSQTEIYFIEIKKKIFTIIMKKCSYTGLTTMSDLGQFG